MKDFIEETQTCSHCGKIIRYTSKGGWYSAAAKLREGRTISCPPCAGKIGRSNSNIAPTGRPRGKKNREGIVAWNKGNPNNIKNIGWDKTETRMLQIARRNGYKTYEEYRDTLPEWKKYKIDVWRITNQQPLHLLENYDKRGVNGQDGVYTIDHIYSIKKGFDNKISAEEIGNIKNLQMLPWEENITKGWK